MKKFLATILSLGIAASAALAANPAVTAVKVSYNFSSVDANSAVWSKAKFSTVMLYPQTAIQFNDKSANALNENAKAKKAQVGALYDGKNLAMIVKWSDKTADTQRCQTTTKYSDGFAVQFAAVTPKAQPLPYIGMGSIGRPVVIHLQKATEKFYEPNGNKEVQYQINRQQTGVFGQELADFDSKVASLAVRDYERSFVAEGFRSTTQVKDGSIKSSASMVHAADAWTGTLVRPLKDEYVNLAGTAPIALAIWDGSTMGRNGLKNLTSWVALNFEGQKENAAIVEDLTTENKGDPVKGKAAVDANGCAGCHQMTASDAPSFMAPSLKNVGGYSASSYLRESLVKPSAVVVPGYNRNAHKNTPWYNLEKGKRVSTMTDYSFLDKQTIEDIVAYLKTLKAEVE